MTYYNKLTDPELADLLKAGDEAAFKVVYQTYWDKLLAIAGKRLGDVNEAEETVQDIFLNLWKRREKFELNVNFEHYFAVAVKFEVINRLAKRSREQQRNDAFAKETPAQQLPVEIRFDLEKLRQELETTIHSLPPKCQLIFRMSREQHLTNKKIAEYLNISEKAVEKHITTALKVLRSRFGSRFTIILLLLSGMKH
ncbi:RNA polymerase sigma factor [Chitinophaga pinensis]|uniref:RNA polymerase sigma-70 factor n=1 Tax=Chitinophaga pinensis TaxID=79329 RepID=A0A5C6LLS6_9BACT|nr:RNA polymerase sigma-70 factor [Chitinophaga pinensis]TWV94696.1 RNA polymerase sigma-70 factor [Chitinophaga pinensis]